MRLSRIRLRSVGRATGSHPTAISVGRSGKTDSIGGRRSIEGKG